MITHKIGAAVATAAAGFALLMAPAAATAEPVAAAQEQVGVQSDTCYVDVDRANYRDAPNGKILGSVGRGQGFIAHNWKDGWYVGDLMGGRANVWMHYSVLNWPCGD